VSRANERARFSLLPRHRLKVNYEKKDPDVKTDVWGTRPLRRNVEMALCWFLRNIWNFSTVCPAETSIDNLDVRRSIQLAILFVASLLSSKASHGQTQDEFIAGCAVGAFDSYSALKANCPPRTREQVIDVRPAFTPQQLDEMNKCAREGAAALQQYLNKQSNSTIQPTVTKIDATPSNSPKNQVSDEIFLYPPSTLPNTPPSGGALTGIAKSASQHQQNASSGALANAQRKLYEAEREMAESAEWGKFVTNQHAVLKAGLDAVSAALAAGAPLVKEGLTLDEAKALEKGMHLNPSRVHILPGDLEPFNSKGEIQMSHGMAVEYFRYSLVGDVDGQAEQGGVKLQEYNRAERPESEAAKQKTQEAYDRCIAMNDESHQMEIEAKRGGKGNDRRWLRARAYCRVNLGESLDQIVKYLDAAGLGR
jgi:hypothetical protein